jgi:two-component system response regulator ResD
LRRLQHSRSEQPSNLLYVGNITIDMQKHQILIGDTDVYFTTKEYALMIYMAQNKDISLGRDQIVDAVWGYEYPGDMRQVDDLVKRVRRKLLQNVGTASIETVWGFGYKLSVKD